jgi:indole-3-acetate monooxygenase
MFFPVDQATMKDIWHVIGLRGTASDGYSVTDLFVPQAHTAPRNDDLAERRYFGPLYDLTAYSMFACGFACLAMGLARSLLDSFIALAQEKTPRGYKYKLRGDGNVQAEIAFAEAQLQSARRYLLGSLSDAWDGVRQTGEVTLVQRMAMRLAATYAIRQAKGVADTAYDTAGTTAVFASNPFERRFRDIHTVAQQLQGRKSHYQTVGQYLMGLPPEQGWF